MRTTIQSLSRYSLKVWVISGLLVLCGLHGLAMSVSPAYAQSTRDIANRLNRLENEIETLNRAVYRGETPPPGARSSGDPAVNADTQVRLQQMEIEFRDLRGKVEEQDFEIRQLKTQLERSLSDMELRLGDIESGRGSAPVSSGGARAGGPVYQDTPPAPAANGGENGFSWSSQQDSQLGTLRQPAAGGGLSAPDDSAAGAYENAFALLKNAQYDGAEKGFAEFLRNNPDHILAGNAKYWLGETHYVRGDLQKAARIFAEGYKQYPKGSKAADNLLKLGLSLAGMGNSSDACVALGQLTTEYPTGALPVLRRAEQEMARLDCDV